MISHDVLRSFEATLLPGTDIPYSHICSWAVFGQAAVPSTMLTDAADIGFPRDETDKLLDTLHTDAVLLALNPGSAAKDQRDNWTAFHIGGKHHDERLAEACRTTRLWGCLMTDLFPLIIDSKSEKVTDVLWGKKPAPAGEEENYDLKANIDAFEESLTLAGVAYDADVTLICVGTDVETWAKRLLHGSRNWKRLATSARCYTLVRVQHYSDRNRNFNHIPPDQKASGYAQWVADDLRRDAPHLLLNGSGS